VLFKKKFPIKQIPVETELRLVALPVVIKGDSVDVVLIKAKVIKIKVNYTVKYNRYKLMIQNMKVVYETYSGCL